MRPTREELFTFIRTIGTPDAVELMDREADYQERLAACGKSPEFGEAWEIYRLEKFWLDTPDGGLAIRSIRHYDLPIDAHLLPLVREHMDHDLKFYGNGITRADNYGIVSFLSGGKSDREAPIRVTHVVCGTCYSKVMAEGQ